jgi:hypothetical protein
MKSIDRAVEALINSASIESDHMKSYLIESSAAVNKLAEIFDQYNIAYAIIGGVAVIEYKHVRMTEDIDVLVASEDKSKLNDIPIGVVRKISDKRFSLHNPRAKVEIIYSGEISGDGVKGLEFPDPQEISVTRHDVNFINLPKLIEFKLSSGIYGKRHKDFGDVQELIRVNKLPKNYGDSFREDLKKKYLELWNDTEDYKSQG